MTKNSQATSQEEKKLNSIINAVKDAVVMMDDKNQVELWNSAAESMFGYSAKEAIGRELHPLIAVKREHQEKKDNLEKFAHTGQSPVIGKTVELEVRRKNGTKFTVELSVSGLKLKNRWHSIGTMRDVSERKKSAEELKLKEEKYRLLFEESRDAIMILEPPDWKITSANRATLDLFNIKDGAELKKLGPWDLSPQYQPDGSLSSKKAKKMIEKVIKEGSVFFEWKHKKLKGAEFPATVLLTRFRLDKKILLQATVRDISIQKSAEQSLKDRVDEIEKINSLMIGRELKMIELKEKIKELEKLLSKKSNN